MSASNLGPQSSWPKDMTAAEATAPSPDSALTHESAHVVAFPPFVCADAATGTCLGGR